VIVPADRFANSRKESASASVIRRESAPKRRRFAREHIFQFVGVMEKHIQMHAFVILQELVLPRMEAAKSFWSLLYDS
jgi:hypothetical protein